MDTGVTTGAMIIGAGATTGVGAASGSSRKWAMTSPNFNWSPSRRRASVMDWPLSIVPFVEFRSFRKKSLPIRVILACERETDDSLNEMEFPFMRPRVIASSRTMCSTDGRPGSWMVKVGMVRLNFGLAYSKARLPQSLKLKRHRAVRAVKYFPAPGCGYPRLSKSDRDNGVGARNFL